MRLSTKYSIPPVSVITWAVSLARPVVEKNVAMGYAVVPFAMTLWRLKLKGWVIYD